MNTASIDIPHRDTPTSPDSDGAAPSTSSLDLGVVGNCSYSALIDKLGRVVWCCLPRFDGDPVFNALLDPEESGSVWTFALENFSHSEQWYEPNTAVLKTCLYDTLGQAVEITDFAPRFASRGRFFRPQMLVRCVRPLIGSARLRVLLRPRFDWGREQPEITRGSNHVRYVGSAMTLRLNTDAPISYLLDETAFVVSRSFHFLLGPDETLSDGIEEIALSFEQQTIAYWRHWSRSLATPLEWQAAVIRAAITLKMSVYEDTGAIIAAMTTSVPEAPGSVRNWDYRYCWLRDAFFVVRALNSLSELGTMEDYLRWLTNVVVPSGGGHVQPLYGIGLEESLPEQVMAHLPGYRHHAPVRVGNQAFEHFQHDVYGNIVLGAAQAFHDARMLHQAGKEQFHHLEAVGERAFEVYDQPDAGMWELRTRSRIHTSSALMCWAACDRLGKIALRLDLAQRASHWQARAALIGQRILTEAWNEERQTYAESFGGRDLDASVLLMVEVGLIAPTDKRFVATVDALEQHLCDGPYMRRYEAPDDFGRPETAFNICTFWRIDALARIGRKQQAREIFEAMLAGRNHVGLLSEDTDPVSGKMWGNFPQTYSMVGIINCAMRLSTSWESVI